MLQSARNKESRSFLRELEFGFLMIKNPSVREYFLSKLSQIDSNRKSLKTKTGEKDIKSEILAYLKQKGYVQTANIWARALSMDRQNINELLKILQQKLLENNIEGVLEIHLQDREINSPHIQFVGINASKAEMLIAKTLIDLKYETNMESALSKKIKPYYETNPKAQYPKNDDLKNATKYFREKQKQNISDEAIEKLINEFNIELKNLKNKLEKKEIKIAKNAFLNKLQKMKNDNKKHISKMKEQRMKYRLKRLRRRRK